jgi:HSP20 family protein
MQAEFSRLLGEPAQVRSTPLAFAFYEREGALLLRTPLPGLEAKDLTLEIDANLLTLTGEFAPESAEPAAAAKHVERPRGCFTRTLHLPFEIDAARVQARLEHGVLEIELPRLVKTPPVKIQVLADTKKN